MNTEKLVESCYVLTAKQVIKSKPINDKTSTTLNIGVNKDIEYWQNTCGDDSEYELSINGKEPQIIKLEWQTITFGDKAYFKCECGSLVSKLYLPIKSAKFLCRKCHGLQYELSGFNKTSVAGQKLYKLNRLIKLSESRASMGRILYKGEYSKRFKSFLRLCEKAGFHSVVQGAKELQTIINSENFHEDKILHR